VRAVLRSQFLSALGASPVALTLPGPGSQIAFAVVGPLSGPARPIGQQLVAGVQGAVDEANNYSVQLAPGSQTYTVRTYDDQNAVAVAILEAQFATGDSTIVAAIGHVSSQATLAAIQTYANSAMPLMVPLNTDVRITQTNNRNVFRLPTNDTDEGFINARAAIKQYKPKVPYVFVQDADYGADVANGFIEAMNQAKITTPYQQFHWDKPDFGAVVDKALTASPDFIFLAGTTVDMGGILPVLRAKGYTGPIAASQGFFDAATLKLGDAANNLTISTSMPYLPYAPTATRYVNDYQARSGPLTPVAAFGYAATQILLSAITISGAAIRSQLLSALHTGQPVETVAGSFAFGANGDTIDPQLYFYTVRDGKISYLHQAHPSSFMIR
jgi:branched-chain amino acid transport system substrate-binding protein